MKTIKALKERLCINNDEALQIVNELYIKYSNNDIHDNVHNEENVPVQNSFLESLSEINFPSKKQTVKVKVKQPKAQVISTTSQKSLFSSLSRGLIGGFISPLGAVAGIATGKNKHKTTFVTRGILGNKKVVTAKNGSRKFKKLAKKCK